jgi:hypothetical protein
MSYQMLWLYRKKGHLAKYFFLVILGGIIQQAKVAIARG